jgi:integrase
MNLTKKFIDSMKFNREKAQDIRWDGGRGGFGVRVYPSGAKTFVLAYRHEGRKHIVTLGRYGVLTVDQARTLAVDKLSGLAMKGDDPFKEKDALHKTIKDLCDDYMTRHACHKKSSRDDQRRIDQAILPAWSNHRVSSVTRADVSALFFEVSKRGVYEGNRTLALLHKMFNLAGLWGYVEENAPNPAHGIQKNKEQKRDRWVTHEELPRLAACIDAESHYFARMALWLYLLTGVRKSELLTAKWDAVDFERRELRLGDTKAGRIHYVPLSEAALTILRNLERMDGNHYVLPGHKTGQHLVNISKPWIRVRKAAGVEDVRLHDLRRTVGSWLAQAGNSLHLIGRVLNHSNTSTTAVYARFGQDHVRQAMEDHGKQLMATAGKRPMADVVELTGRKAGRKK